MALARAFEWVLYLASCSVYASCAIMIVWRIPISRGIYQQVPLIKYTFSLKALFPEITSAL